METNRIDYFFELAGKNATSKAAPKNNGFADLLFGVMGKRADRAAAEAAQVRPAPSPALQPLSAWEMVDSNQDEGRNAAAVRDHRIGKDRDPAASKDNEKSVACTTQGPQGQPAARAHPQRKTGADHKAICGTQNAADTEVVDSGAPVEGSGDTDLVDETQDLALGTDESEGESASTDGEPSDQPGEPQVDLLPVACALAAETAVVVAAIETEATPLAAAAVASDEAAPSAEIDQAAALAAAAKLLDLGDIGPDGNGITPQLVSDGPAMGDLPESAATAAGGVTFAATAVLAEANNLDSAIIQPQTAAMATIAAEGERELDDADNLFRRNPGNGRKAAPVGPGTTLATHAGQQNNGAQTTTPVLQATVTSGSAGKSAGGATASNGIAPVGFDAGLGTQTGLPGWNLHLAQGAATRRGDFVANLRQHLQNLPIHDQVALSIQRSLRDGGGSITLQLSPTELGRIHLKLNIDEENNVQASVMVERPATLDLLQRDMKALERALQEAGLKAGPGDLSFSLQGGDPETFARDFGSGNGSGSGGSGRANDEGAEELTASAAAAVIATGDGWVDVQV